MSSLIAAIYAYDRNETTANELLDALRAAPTVEGFSFHGSSKIVAAALEFCYGLRIVNEVKLTVDESSALFDFMEEDYGEHDFDIESGDAEYADIRAVVFEGGRVLFVPYVDEDGEPTAKFFSLESAA